MQPSPPPDTDVPQGSVPDDADGDGQGPGVDDAADAQELGRKIRLLRKRAGMTLGDLAARVGVSPSLISQVERGHANGSIATLRSIASALEVPLAVLFTDTEDTFNGQAAGTDAVRLVRRSHRRHLDAGEGVRLELLADDESRSMDFIWVELSPGASVPSEAGTFVAHAGTESAVSVSGSVVLLVGSREFPLDEGDSVCFDAQEPHRFENRGTAPVVMVSAVARPRP